MQPTQDYLNLLMPGSPLNLPADYPLRMIHNIRQEPIALHTHHFMELAVITEGSAIHQTLFAEEELIPGTVLVVLPEQVHGYRQVSNLKLSNICFMPDVIDQEWFQALYAIDGAQELFAPTTSPATVRTLKLPSATLPALCELLDRLFQELACQLSGYTIIAKSILTEIIGLICRFSSLTRSLRPISAHRIVSAIEYMEQNYRQEITLQELADHQSLSKSSLIKLFREATGLTPTEYLIHLRLQKAIALFCNPALSLTEIAYSVGFNDSNYFSRQFKQQLKVTPKQYRLKMRTR